MVSPSFVPYGSEGKGDLTLSKHVGCCGHANGRIPPNSVSKAIQENPAILTRNSTPRGNLIFCDPFEYGVELTTFRRQAAYIQYARPIPSWAEPGLKAPPVLGPPSAPAVPPAGAFPSCPSRPTPKLHRRFIFQFSGFQKNCCSDAPTLRRRSPRPSPRMPICVADAQRGDARSGGMMHARCVRKRQRLCRRGNSGVTFHPWNSGIMRGPR